MNRQGGNLNQPEDSVREAARLACREVFLEAGRTVPPGIREKRLTFGTQVKKSYTDFSLYIPNEVPADAECLIEIRVDHVDLSVETSVDESVMLKYTVPLEKKS